MQYVAPASGKRPVEIWLDEVPDGARRRFLAVLVLAARERQWQSPEFKRLTVADGKYKYGEFRVLADRTQWRLIGRSGPRPGEYTLLIGCSHKQSRYDPPNALETAVRRWSEIERGNASVVEFRPGS
jgi:hypothetical protein